MATLLLSAVGATVGGPLGGLMGGLVGRQVDAAIFGSPTREGPRLDDLRITTSSYGSSIPAHHGTVRAPGTIIWATDLVEHAQNQGGGKEGSSVTIYTYSISFAVALSSRPIQGVGRIWADGNLLRGAAGDMKVGGALRIYTGHGDHQPDPLIAAAQGTLAPAFRRTAYVVFEDLDLATFGNRIPSLTFEVVADDGPLDLAQMLTDLPDRTQADMPLSGLVGFSCEGGPIVATLATIASVYPLVCEGGGDGLSIRSAEDFTHDPPTLTEPAVTAEEGGYGAFDGRHRKREAADGDIPSVLRYFDVDRDYLAGVQRADGRARAGRERTIEFPGALPAHTARSLANGAAQRAGWSRETLAWRMAELDPELGPGRIVRAPGMPGLWRILSWEWREHGVELELLRIPHGPARQPPGDPGGAHPAIDLVAGPTILRVIETPWSGAGGSNEAEVYAALSSETAGWTGAMLYADRSGQLSSLAGTRQRSIIGDTLTALEGSAAMLFDRQASLTVRLLSADFGLASATADMLAKGANRALLGGEVIQFATAIPLGTAQWRLDGLMRGRMGTEAAAMAGHHAGTSFIVPDKALLRLDPAALGHGEDGFAAIGLADPTPATTIRSNSGASLRPLSPVHPRIQRLTDGGMLLQWTRRARGAWAWLDEVDVPMVEEREAYLVGLGPVTRPFMAWEVSQAQLELDPITMTHIETTHGGAPVWVRQIGSFSLSPPLALTIIP